MPALLKNKLLLLALILCTWQTAQAQNYHPMIVNDSVVWNMFYAEEGGTYYEYQYRMAGDTIINGTSYKKLDEYGPGIYEPSIAVRESKKRVYAITYTQSFRDTEIIAYDFNLEVGDTFIRADPRRKSKCPMVLRSIDSVMLDNGEYRKRYNFKDSCYGQYTYWIEGIGSSRGPFDFRTDQFLKRSKYIKASIVCS